MKKIYLILASLMVLLLSSMSVNAAKGVVYTEGYLEYIIENDAISICGYFGKETEVTIPSMIAGYPVSKISKNAFEECKTVKTVNLPDTIMEIESEAFGIEQKVIYNSNVEIKEESKPEESKPEESKPEESEMKKSEEKNYGIENSIKESVETNNEEVDKTIGNIETNKSEYKMTGEIMEEKNSDNSEKDETEEFLEPGFEEVEVTLEDQEFEMDHAKKSRVKGGVIVGAVVVMIAVGFFVFKKKG